jgi:hypothetical protein
MADTTVAIKSSSFCFDTNVDYIILSRTREEVIYRT